MGMSNYIMDVEEACWDRVADSIGECEHVSEAKKMAMDIFLAERMLGVVDIESIEEGVDEMWNEYWSKYI
jgi:hypothetical protein|tara:strand:- start:1130 stop:1339 length:210 start_codon:yes stop_codon:yes gene_type:complete